MLNQEYLKALRLLPASAVLAALQPEPVPTTPRFNAVVVDHHDGDTILVDLDTGLFGERVPRQNVRIAGCAARELGEPGGIEAREAMKRRLPVGTRVVLTLVKWDKYGGRIDAVVSYPVGDVVHDLAADLIADWWAAAWNGRGTQPKPPWPRP